MRSTRYRQFCNTREDKESNLLCHRKKPNAKLSQIWVKASAEQQFLYGHHIMKSGLGRITENTPKYQGVIVHSMADLPIGFGVAKATSECRHADPMNIVA